MTAIFLFHRDLRIHDNLAYNKMLQDPSVSSVVNLFCFSPDQIDPNKNEYYNPFAIEFMCECIQDLNKQLNGMLNSVHGNEVAVIQKICKKKQIVKIYQNQDITPYALKRSRLLEDACTALNIQVVSVNGDYTLYPVIPKPVKLFAKYKSLVSNTEIPRPTYIQNKLPSILIYKRGYKHKYLKNREIAVHGGRELGLARIKQLDLFKEYAVTRDQLAKTDGTTKIGAHLKFGSVSVREFYWGVVDRFGKSHGLINELVWRSYFDHLIVNFPDLLRHQVDARKNLSLSTTFHDYKWNSDKNAFTKWSRGETGVSLVDAAMNQMHRTGFMHNRCRMVVAMYAVRHLKLDWTQCERHFARYLIDYAPAQNVGNWSWILSYRFTLSSKSQQERFDRDGTYLKRWAK